MTNAASTMISIPVAPGELIDKITILQIKVQRLRDRRKLANVRKELALLQAQQEKHIRPDEKLSELGGQLLAVNEAIWDLEDAIRRCEANQEFGENFVAVARRIYQRNDRRAELKREINLHLGSELLEEKSY
jgi:hypothetical protein